MKVKEVIAALQALDPECVVCVLDDHHFPIEVGIVEQQDHQGYSVWTGKRMKYIEGTIIMIL